LFQLTKYLRREKEVLQQRLELSESSVSRLEVEVNGWKRRCEEASHKLKETTSGGGGQVEIITSSRQAELLRKVETLSALTDSNR